MWSEQHHQFVAADTPTQEGANNVSDQADSTAGAAPSGGVPWHVRFFGRILKSLIGAGIPLGFNRLVTIRGRKSGLPRTAALAVLKIEGRRWVWAPWGEVQWVQNLRAAGNATIAEKDRQEEVRAVELDPTQRVGFFRDVLGPFARSLPLGYWFIRAVDGVDLNDPVAAAKARPVFELLAVPAVPAVPPAATESAL